MSSQKPDGSTSSLSPLGKPIPKSTDTPRPPLPLECAQDPVDNFFAFVKEYCTGEDFKRLKELSLENKKLRDRVEKLEIAYHENISALAKSDANCRSEHDRCEEANRARVDALGELRDKGEAVKKLNARINGLENDIKTLTITSKSWEKQTMDSTAREEARAAELKRAEQDIKNLQHKLQTAAKQLESKSTELGRVRDNFRVVRSFVVELDSIGDEKAHIQGLLAGFFSLAQKLMEDFLRNDLDRPCLDDCIGWDNLRTQVSANEYIPLPASNSVAAKGMRVVAGLVLLGRALVEYVFRPVHIMQHNELDMVLGDLGSQNPLQEMYARASLLKILPDRQKKNQEASIELVVRTLSHMLNHLIPLSRQDEFKLSLRGVTAQICRSWSRVQKLEEKIKPSFSFDLPEDWQQLPPEIPRAPSSHSIQSPKQEKKAGRQVQQQSPRSSPSTLLPGSVLNTELKEVIWPAFLVADPDHSQQETEEDGGIDLSWALIFQGYILTNTQAKTAEQERATEQEASRRARKIARQNSSDYRQAIRKRRDSAIDFLKPSRDDLKETDGK